MAAPEEIAPAPEMPQRPERGDRGERRSRDDFADGVWVSLSVGRAQAAEPRWLIPMICRLANLTKRDLGAIRIHDHETHVEFSPEGARAFFAAIDPDGHVEKNIVATARDGAPAQQPRGQRRAAPRERREAWHPDGRPEPRPERREPRIEPRAEIREEREPRPENRAERRARAFGKPAPAEPMLKAKPRTAHNAKQTTFGGKAPPKHRPATSKKHK
jgi:ATP-dependent RNA helicase DeaD